ncbi:MAG: lycopene cyclase domain-containing protein [Bacteroidetes bacterium]|nr:MAG: lycopene cyclase domain-containing protein [Bacteroidota bacterium]
MTLYAWVMFCSLIGPLALSFDKKVAFYKYWLPLFAGIVLNGALFIAWDGWFARTGVWGFNPQYVWNLRINDLPVEEWSFFVVVPYASVFIYKCLQAYIPKEPFANSKHHITLFFTLLTFVLALLNSDKTYTFYNCLIASVLLLVHYLFIKSTWMGYFWLAYLVHLVPFLVVNGILTGAVTPEPVVWYNEGEILGPRIYTIPVEDTIYALTCLLLPITVMEWLGKKLLRQST